MKCVLPVIDKSLDTLLVIDNSADTDSLLIEEYAFAQFASEVTLPTRFAAEAIS